MAHASAAVLERENRVAESDAQKLDIEIRAPRRSGEELHESRSSAAKTRDGKAQGKKNLELGRRGEEAAARFLYRRGYEILERNWSCFAGEADIIARDGDSLVFVEVKTRRDCQKGFPSEAVNKKKRDRYEKIALAYIAECEFMDLQLRFDVVSIVVVASDRALIRHHINAFAAA